MLKNCELTKKYLNNAKDIFKLKTPIIDSRTVFEDDLFIDCFNESLKYVNKNPNSTKNIWKENFPNSKKLYLALEIAETLYLKREYGVLGKIGPTSEEYFDEAINDINGSNYVTIICSPGYFKAGYLSERNSYETQGDFEKLIKKIRYSPSGYVKFIKEIMPSNIKLNYNSDTYFLLGSINGSKTVYLNKVLKLLIELQRNMEGGDMIYGKIQENRKNWKKIGNGWKYKPNWEEAQKKWNNRQKSRNTWGNGS